MKLFKQKCRRHNGLACFGPLVYLFLPHGLLRASHSLNPAPHSDIARLTPPFILILGRVPKTVASVCASTTGSPVLVLWYIYFYHTDCSVLLTPSILPLIRISQGLRLLLSSYWGESLKQSPPFVQAQRARLFWSSGRNK